MSEQPAVKLGDLEDAMEFVSSGQEFDNAAWLRRDTGEVIWHSDFIDVADEFGPLPEDIGDDDHYVAIPDKRDLGLGKPLAPVLGPIPQIRTAFTDVQGLQFR